MTWQQVIISKSITFRSLEISFALPNSVDPDGILQYASFFCKSAHLGVSGLQRFDQD